MKKMILPAILLLGAQFALANDNYTATASAPVSGQYSCASFGYYTNIAQNLVQNWLNANCDKVRPFSIAISDAPEVSATEVCCIQK